MNCRGIALVTGLLILAAISLIAITAAGSMSMQRKQAANYHDKALALANAELAESWAKAWLFSRADIERQPSCTRNCVLPIGIHSPGELPKALENQAKSWWSETAMPSGGDPASGSTAANPDSNSFWLMEEAHFLEITENRESPGPAGIGFYRIFSFGAGRHPRSAVVTESIVARPWQADVTPVDFPPSKPLNSFCSGFPRDIACGAVAWRQLK